MTSLLSTEPKIWWWCGWIFFGSTHSSFVGTFDSVLPCPNYLSTVLIGQGKNPKAGGLSALFVFKIRSKMG